MEDIILNIIVYLLFVGIPTLLAWIFLRIGNGIDGFLNVLFKILSGICAFAALFIAAALSIYTLPIVLGLYIFYIVRKVRNDKWLDKHEPQLKAAAEHFSNDYGIPIDSNHTYKLNTKQGQQLLKFQKEIDSINASLQIADKSGKRALREKLYNEKLLAFYMFAIPSESSFFRDGFLYGDLTYYFENLLQKAQKSKDLSILRTDANEKLFMEESQTEYDNQINQIESDLKEDNFKRKAKALSELQKISNESEHLGGLIKMTNMDALRYKSEQMKEIWEEIQLEADVLQSKGAYINIVLQYARLCAFRNIYLGQEIVNYLLQMQDGGELTTEKSFAMTDMSHLTSLNLQNFNTDASTSIFEQMKSYHDSVNMFKSFGLSKDSAKLFGGIAAVASNAIKERNEEIKKHLELQKQILGQISNAGKSIQRGQAGILDAIKIVRAINDANRAFMKYYIPLRHYVFETHEFNKVTKQDVVQLDSVLERYVEISKASIGMGEHTAKLEKAQRTAIRKSKKAIEQLKLERADKKEAGTHDIYLVDAGEYQEDVAQVLNETYGWSHDNTMITLNNEMPVILRYNRPKKEAQALKKQLEEVGATVVID